MSGKIVGTKKDRIAESMLPMFLAAVLILEVGYMSSLLADSTFQKNNNAKVWIAINTLQPILWSGMLLANRGMFQWKRGAFLGYSGLIIVLCFFVVFLPEVDAQGRIVGASFLWFMRGYVLVGTSVAALVAGILGCCYVDLLSKSSFELPELLDINRRLNQALVSLSTMIVVIVFAESWYQRALTDLGLQQDAEGSVLRYGLYFSALLAVAYTPALLRYREMCTRLVDALVPLPNGGAEPPDSKVLDARKSHEQRLGLVMRDTNRAVLAALSPTIAAVLSIATGKLGPQHHQSEFGRLRKLCRGPTQFDRTS